MNGTDILAKIKGAPALRRHPVVVLTTTDDKVEIERCYDLGCQRLHHQAGQLRKLRPGDPPARPVPVRHQGARRRDPAGLISGGKAGEQAGDIAAERLDRIAALHRDHRRPAARGDIAGEHRIVSVASRKKEIGSPSQVSAPKLRISRSGAKRRDGVERGGLRCTEGVEPRSLRQRQVERGAGPLPSPVSSAWPQ